MPREHVLPDRLGGGAASAAAWDLPRTCQPLVVEGGRCLVDADCVSGWYCAGVVYDEAVLDFVGPGTCTPPQPDGARCRSSRTVCSSGHCDAEGLCSPCASDEDCDEAYFRYDLLRDPETQSQLPRWLYCMQGRCEMRVVGAFSDGAACVLNENCRSGWCAGTDITSGICISPTANDLYCGDPTCLRCPDPPSVD